MADVQTFLEILRMAEDTTRAERWTDAARLWAQVVALNPVRCADDLLLVHRGGL
jgi:hypothetical protein